MKCQPQRGKHVTYTIDVYAGGIHPSVGNVIRRCLSSGKVLGYLRVLALRPVRVRVSRGEEVRYRVSLQWLSCEPEEGADMTVYDHPRHFPTAPRRPVPDPAAAE